MAKFTQGTPSADAKTASDEFLALKKKRPTKNPLDKRSRFVGGSEEDHTKLQNLTPKPPVLGG